MLGISLFVADHEHHISQQPELHLPGASIIHSIFQSVRSASMTNILIPVPNHHPSYFGTNEQCQMNAVHSSGWKWRSVSYHLEAVHKDNTQPRCPTCDPYKEQPDSSDEIKLRARLQTTRAQKSMLWKNNCETVDKIYKHCI
ncbi:hypothetical protein NDU88_000110 [Pleurodeles waltl]|uniref:Uncharacterized protein n=1 Tax=Pleurodeles waltl TaxID=8319 RepID=A0AAV7KSL9_PLEWA|nr:hypothetical protein NDU88_000110 [Pleurodeles waltl]